MGSTLAVAPPAPATSPSPWRVAWFWLGLAGLFATTAAVVLLAWAVLPTLHPSLSASIVSSGSMTPRIDRGDVVVWDRQVAPELHAGTVVVFTDTGGRSTIHRIHDLAPDGRYVTRGDASRTPDTDLLTPDRIDGTGSILVPLIGRPALWLRERQVIPLLALIALATVAVAASRVVWDPTFDPWVVDDDAHDLRPLAHEPLGLAPSLRVVADEDLDRPLLDVGGPGRWAHLQEST